MLIPSQFRLLVHHHDIAYVDAEGIPWLTAGIGRWVSALADYFQEVGLLVYQSTKPLPRQDTPLNKKNVCLYSLGAPGHYWDHIPRMRRLRRVCQQVGQHMDGLLIRGVTPRQYSVWRFTPVSKKAFLLVGSLGSNLLRLDRFPIGIFLAVMARNCLSELRKMADHDTLLMANSPILVSEIDTLLEKKAYFVPTNSLQRDEFAPFQVRAVTDPWKLLYCGRLDLKKGLRELFQAVAILKDQGQLCQVDMVAQTKEPIYSQLVDLAKQLQITDQICWHGLVPYGAELFKFYQRAETLILPTYTEGFPRVIWEAAANCCPVITTAVGGIPALWEHEKHGLLIPPKDADAIVSAIRRIFLEDTLRHRLIEQAYQHALDFTVEACARKLTDTLSEEWN